MPGLDNLYMATSIDKGSYDGIATDYMPPQSHIAEYASCHTISAK